MAEISINGFCDPAFDKVKQAFIGNFKKGKERGAAVSIVIEGKTVVDIWEIGRASCRERVSVVV